jgi:hypothetical protein
VVISVDFDSSDICELLELIVVSNSPFLTIKSQYISQEENVEVTKL